MNTPIVYKDKLIEFGTRKRCYISDLTAEERELYFIGYKEGDRVGSERGAICLVIFTALLVGALFFTGTI